MLEECSKKALEDSPWNTYILLYHSLLVGVIIILLSTPLVSCHSCRTYFHPGEPILRPYSDLHPMQLTERLTLLSERKTCVSINQ